MSTPESPAETLPERSFQVDQEDGARWSVYTDPSDGRSFTIVTSAGHDEIQGEQKDILRGLVNQYRAAEIGGIALLGESPDMRQELGRGQEAIVYSMGPYAVREERSIKGVYAALGQLQRMDEINSVIDEGLPRWLNLPSHYALHADPQQQKTYTLMERIDGGLTFEDILNYPEVSDAKAKLVEAKLGKNVDEAKATLPELFEESHAILSDAISAKGKVPGNYLTDWHPRNVLVERQETPVAGKNYKLNVIDQYRS